MNNNKRIITRVVRTVKALCLGIVMAMTCSCEDFLTILPTDKVVLEDFWKSKEDVENMVAESYRLMSHWDFLSRVIVWGELRGDNVVEGNYNGNNDIKNIMEANLLPTNQYTSWSPFYTVINNCNQVLKYAPEVLNEDPDFTQGDLDVVRGEMLALRALCHFYLVRTFRDVPLLMEAKVDDSQNLYQDQVDPVVVLDSCLRDLKEAELLVLTTGNYPVDNELDNRNMGRVTKDAVRAIIADVCLWKGAFLEQKDGGADAAGIACYNECIAYCDKVLDARMAYAENYVRENRFNDFVLNDSLPIVYSSDPTGGYKPNARFPHLPYSMSFGGGSHGCNNPIESILEVQHSSLREANGNYEVPYFFAYSNDGTACQYGMLSAARNLALVGEGRLYEPTDFRRVNYVDAQVPEGQELDKATIIKYSHVNVVESDASSITSAFGKLTYTYSEYNTADGKSGGIKDMRYLSDFQVNWNLYRITDVMLMKAEALIVGQQDTTMARNLVKIVYERSQMGYVDNAGKPVGVVNQGYLFDNLFKDTDPLTLVLNERQRELAFEGKRWYDLVRMALRDNTTSSVIFQSAINKKYEGMSTDQYVSKMATMDQLFFPIAEREINTSNGHLTQNPAYETDDVYEKN